MNLIAKVCLVVLPSLLLSACYMSEQPFYAESEGRQAIGDGPYYFINPEKPSYTLRKEGKHAYDVVDGSHTYRMIMVPTAHKKEYIYQAVEKGKIFYGWITIPNQKFVFHLEPRCSNEAEANFATEVGAVLDKSTSGGPSCKFADRASLEAALEKVRRLDAVVGKGVTPLTRRPECAGKAC